MFTHAKSPIYFGKFGFFLNLFAIDVSFSAVSLSFLLAKLFSVKVNFFYYILLFFSVVAVYNFDHFLDQPLSKWSKKIFAFFIASLATVFFTILYFPNLFIPLSTAQYFFLFGQIGAVFLYFCFVHLNPRGVKYVKELFVSILFANGCFLPIFLSELDIAWDSLNNYFMVFFNLFLVLLHNALLSSFFNKKKDLARNRASIVMLLPKETTGKIFTSFGLMVLLSILSFLPPETAGNYRYYLLLALGIQAIVFRYFLRMTAHQKNDDDLFQQKKISFLLYVCNGYFSVLMLIFILFY